MTDKPKSPRRTTILLLAIAVAIVGIVVAVVRTPTPTANDKNSGAATDSTTTSNDPRTASGSSGIVAPTPSGTPNSAASDHAAAPSGSPGAVTSGSPVDMADLLLEAKVVEAARAALAAGDPKKALKELEAYDRITTAQSLKQEATVLKIEALSKVGRKTDALALAYLTREDPAFNTYKGRIEALIDDAGR